MHARRSSLTCLSRASFPAFRRHSRSARRAAGPVAGRRCRGRRRRHAPAGRPAQRCRQPRAAAVRLARFARAPTATSSRSRPTAASTRRSAGLRNTRFDTSNTRATITTAVPNGTYWWRVRAVTKAGQVSGWSTPRSVRKAWTAAPHASRPRQRCARLLPLAAPDPLVVARAARGEVPRLARAPTRTSPRSSATSRSRPSGTSYAPSLTPSGGKDKTFYWAVTRSTHKGNRGAQSRIASFVWEWPSQTATKLTDLRAEPETFDPQFSWQPVAGAARYELEVSYSRDFAPGSKVCCGTPVIGTSHSPTSRCRTTPTTGASGRSTSTATSASGIPTSADASRFEKVFDKAAALGRSSISNLHMRDDRNDPRRPGRRRRPSSSGTQVPGASSYLVEVVAARRRLLRLERHRRSLARHDGDDRVDAARLSAAAPRAVSGQVLGRDRHVRLVAGQLVLRPRAREVGHRLEPRRRLRRLHLPERSRPGRVHVRRAIPAPPACTRAYLGGRRLPRAADRQDDDAVLHLGRQRQRGQLVRARRQGPRVPQHRRLRLDAGARLCASRSARTRSPTRTRRPRTTGRSSRPPGFNGASRRRRPALGLAGEVRQAVDPAAARRRPRSGAKPSGPPVFTWTAVEGARRYNLQVSREDDFGKLLDNVTTASILHGQHELPGRRRLYWRVRAEDEEGSA